MALGLHRSARMSSGLLLDPMPPSNPEPTTTGPRYRPYASPNHHVTKGRYITSNDPRGYIPVYEYPLNGQWIMLDMDDGYVLWTGIWKALGNNKADIVKIIDSQPDLASQLRRVRGGYLKIQGTWMPYEIALRLARRVAWPIRHELVPLFGPTFPSTCLSPEQPGFGQIVNPGTKRRKPRLPNELSTDPRHGWTVISPVPGPSSGPMVATSGPGGSLSVHRYPEPQGVSSSSSNTRPIPHDTDSPIMLHVPYVEHIHPTQQMVPSSTGRQNSSRRASTPSDGGSGMRYSPYPPSPMVSRPGTGPDHGLPPINPVNIVLPSIHPRHRDSLRPDSLKLPPISAMDAREHVDDSLAVLRRLTSDEDDEAYVHRSARSVEHSSSHPQARPVNVESSSLSPAPPFSSTRPTSHSQTASISGTRSDSSNDRGLSTSSSSDRRASSPPPVWERQMMPPPPSPHAPHDVSDSHQQSQRTYCGAAGDRATRAWRPW